MEKLFKGYNMVKFRYLSFVVILFLLFSYSCSTVKNLSDNEKLYTGAELNVRNGNFFKTNSLKHKLEGDVVPKPNKKFLGFMPLRLWIYNAAGDSVPKKGFRHWLKYKVGEPPVIYNDRFAEDNKVNLENGLYNNGYFDAIVSDSELIRDKKVKLQYSIIANREYLISGIQFPAVNDSLTYYINQTENKSLIKKGDPYNLNQLINERERISGDLSNHGFYNFLPDFLIFRLDSNTSAKTLFVYLDIKKDIPPKAKKIYYLNNIDIYPDHSLNIKDTLYDTLNIKGYKYIYNRDNIKPRVITNSVLFEKGKIYRDKDYTGTVNKLIGTGMFKFVNIEFRDTSQRDTSKLNASVYLTQVIPKSFRINFQAVTKSNDFTGPGLQLSFTDQNLFHGAEEYSFSLKSGYETQLSHYHKGLNSFDISFENQLSVPRLIVPFFNANRYLAKQYTAYTKINANYSIAHRVLYFYTNSLILSYGYNWKETSKKTHDFTPISINYFNLRHTTQLFDSLINNDEFIKESFAEKFILSLSYDYTYDNQSAAKGPVGTYLYTGAEFAGNTISMLNRLFYGRKPNADNPNSFLGVVYSQYAKGYADFRFYFRTGQISKLVTRVYAGFGYPYGNSRVLPYIKQFFIGGSSGLRGFHYHSVGPGAFIPNDSTQFYLDQVGDIKLEGNLEYRFPISGILHGAVFTDAGNIWLVSKNPQKPGGTFYWNKFVSQIAVDAGIGIRLDISFFILRFDLGFPLRIPYLPPGKRWVVDKINPFNSVWRKNNLVLNIAIGYPF